MENTISDVEALVLRKLAHDGLLPNNVKAPAGFQVTGALAVTGDVEITGDTELTGALDVTGDAAVTGATTLTGDLGVTGDADVTGEVSQGSGGAKIIAGDVAYTVTDADNGAVVQTATDNAVISLPNITADNKGMTITVQNTGADGAALVSISPHASDAIKGSVVGITGAGAATIVQASGVVDKDWNNTKATAKSGDYTVLRNDGVDTWWIIGGMGEWVSQG